MLKDLFSTISGFFASLIGLLPSSPFDFDSYVDGLETYLPYVNWFIPFYHLEPLLRGFIGVFFASIAVVVIIKFISRKLGG